MPEATGDVTVLHPSPAPQTPAPALATTWKARRHLKLNLNLCHHTQGFFSTPALGGRGSALGAGSASTGSSPCFPVPRPDKLGLGLSAEEAHLTGGKKSKLDYTSVPNTTPTSALPGSPNHHLHHFPQSVPHSSCSIHPHDSSLPVPPPPHHHRHHVNKPPRSNNHAHSQQHAVSPTTAFISNALAANPAHIPPPPNSPLPSPVVNNCGCGLVCQAPPNTPTHHAHSNNRARSAKLKPISTQELACHMDKTRPLLLIDVRSANSYHQNHIQGAVNLCCTDRFNRRRIQTGNSSVFDILGLRDVGPGSSPSSLSHASSSLPASASPSSAPSPASKRKASSTISRSSMEVSSGVDIVVYDEHSSLRDVAQPGGVVWTMADSALTTVLLALLREGRDVHVLEGGLKSFVLDHEQMTRSSFLPFDPSRPMLYSPTNGVQEPEIETATATQVLPFLYLGNERDAKDLSRLRSLDIRYVLNVTSHVPQYFDCHGIRYKRIPASDSSQQNLRQYFEEAIEYIDLALQQKSRVLVHCHAGVSRSATVTIAYLLKHTRMSMADAYKFLKGKRQIISPNFNFMGQLLEFEQDLNQGLTPRILQPRLQGIESSV